MTHGGLIRAARRTDRQRAGPRDSEPVSPSLPFGAPLDQTPLVAHTGPSTIMCPSCQTPNPTGFRFCGSCGSSLDGTCPSCPATVPAGFRFCGVCGAEIAEVDRVEEPVHEERKVVSVVFADLEASTELATRLDPEDLREVYKPYFEAMAEEIVRHGGAVEKFIGDAVVGVFGAPVTYGDDPVRAVRAALAMQGRLPELTVTRRSGHVVGRRDARRTTERSISCKLPLGWFDIRKTVRFHEFGVGDDLDRAPNAGHYIGL